MTRGLLECRRTPRRAQVEKEKEIIFVFLGEENGLGVARTEMIVWLYILQLNYGLEALFS